MDKNNYSIIEVLIGIFIAVIALAFSRFLIESVGGENILNGLRNVSFIMMGFVVVAFNLRFKLIDLFGKNLYSLKEQRKLGFIVKAKINNINFILVLFVLTAASTGLSPLIGKIWYLFRVLKYQLLSLK